MYQSAGTVYPSPQSICSVELRTVTVLPAGRIGGPPTTLIARPYRLKTIVPIALSRPDHPGAAAVEVVAALTGAANATAAVCGAAVLRVAGVSAMRGSGTTAAAAGSTGVSVDSTDSSDVDASSSWSAAGFAAGFRSCATGLAGWSASFSEVSDPARFACLTVAISGSSARCWPGCSASCGVLASAPGSAVSSFFGLVPEGFVSGLPAPSASEFALLAVFFAASDEVVPVASAPGGLSALAAPAPATVAAVTPAVTIAAPNHTKNRSTMASPVPDRGKDNARCQPARAINRNWPWASQQPSTCRGSVYAQVRWRWCGHDARRYRD